MTVQGTAWKTIYFAYILHDICQTAIRIMQGEIWKFLPPDGHMLIFKVIERSLNIKFSKLSISRKAAKGSAFQAEMFYHFWISSICKPNTKTFYILKSKKKCDHLRKQFSVSPSTFSLHPEKYGAMYIHTGSIYRFSYKHLLTSVYTADQFCKRNFNPETAFAISSVRLNSDLQFLQRKEIRKLFYETVSNSLQRSCLNTAKSSIKLHFIKIPGSQSDFVEIF